MKKRLLALLLLIVVAAGLMFWSTRRQSEKAEIHRLGGTAFDAAARRSSLSWVEDRVGSQIFSQPYEDVNFWQDTLTDDDFTGLRLAGVKSLLLQCPRLTVRSARHISTLTDLERLYLATKNVDDEWLVDIGKLTRLEILNVSNSQVSDRSARVISSLPNLGFLVVAKSRLTSAGLLEVLDAPALKSLVISPDQWSEELIMKCQSITPRRDQLVDLRIDRD